MSAAPVTQSTSSARVTSSRDLPRWTGGASAPTPASPGSCNSWRVVPTGSSASGLTKKMVRGRRVSKLALHPAPNPRLSLMRMTCDRATWASPTAALSSGDALWTTTIGHSWSSRSSAMASRQAGNIAADRKAITTQASAGSGSGCYVTGSGPPV